MTIASYVSGDRRVYKFFSPVVYKVNDHEYIIYMKHVYIKYINIHGISAYDIHDNNNNSLFEIWEYLYYRVCIFLCFYVSNPYNERRNQSNFKKKSSITGAYFSSFL